MGFDALAFGIPPRPLGAIEPVQLLSLDVAARALADAGYGPGSRRELDRSRVSVVFGAEAGTDLSAAYGFRSLASQLLGQVPPALDKILPELTEDSFPGMLANVIVGRIANRLDLGGVNFTVDAACASSLAVLDAGVKELVAGTSDMVLCGGADLHNGIGDFLLFSSVHALSPKGRCASFDAEADGIVLGEGVACVVLKRLEDARRDGDRVYAVIEAVAGSSDGRSLGLTASRPEGQRLALERAYAQAGVSPRDVELVEAHGTGTVVGDRTELSVLEDLYSKAGAEVGACTLGSVKSQIGHTKCAAGLAGLIKVASALYHGVLPPTIHIDSPNPAWDPSSSPFVFRSQSAPWMSTTRRAALSAFGFGGTNFHAVVRAWHNSASPGPTHGIEIWPAEIVALRGLTKEQALVLLGRLERYVERVPSRAEGLRHVLVPSGLLRDLAWAAWRAGNGPVQGAVVVRTIEELRDLLPALREALAGARPPAGSMGAVFVRNPNFDPGPGPAFLFPGQGSQKPGMLAGLFCTFPFIRHHLEAAHGHKWLRVMMPPAAFGKEGRSRQVDALADTRMAQPTLGMAELAVAELLVSWQVEGL